MERWLNNLEIMIEQFENIKFTRDKNIVGRAMKSLFFKNEDF